MKTLSKTLRRLLVGGVFVFSLPALEAPLSAQDPVEELFGAVAGDGEEKEQPLLGQRERAEEVFIDFQNGWKDFAEWKLLAPLLAAVLLAAFLAAGIAYHPKVYGKATSITALEQPKTFIMYAVVGAMVAKVVVANSNMALVVFGIGGLLRFRTDVGAPKDTGRVILVTVMGLACGLNYFSLAVLGTLIGWVIIFILESRAFYKLTVKGIEGTVLVEAAQAYRDVLESGLGCDIVRERKNFLKGQFAFIFRAPGEFGWEELEEHLEEKVPQHLKGGCDWDST